jgi:betaine-aldehyde dehydrogenase
MLHEVARDIAKVAPVVAEMMTREMGKPYKEAADELAWGITAIDYYAEIARHEAGKVFGPVTDGQFHFSQKSAMGTAVLILPFNFPIVVMCWEAAAALSAGNAVIVKPSPNTSMTSVKFMEAFKSLPQGLVQCVTGGIRVGQQLVQSPDTHVVAFTGSIPGGLAVAESCAKSFKRVLIEASGNDPFLVMPSAPLDIAARGAAFAANLNCGQVCVSAERFYVHDAIYDEFVEKVAEEVAKIRIGNGLGKVDMGPMVSERQRDRYESILARAIEQGAKPIIGGGRPAEFNKGWFVDATVLGGVTHDMEIMHDEPFGPVAPMCRVSGLDEAITLANDSVMGLGANIYTTDLKESMRAVNELEAGMVWVNAPLLDNDAGPFGGIKMTGTGRQLGAEGLDQFRHTKMVMIDPNCAPEDFWWFPYSDAESYPGD